MKCPNCGRDVPDGYMYCDKCGEEFHMVPEYEPEIESQMDSILSGLANKIDGTFSNAISKGNTKNENGKTSNTSGSKSIGSNKAQSLSGTKTNGSGKKTVRTHPLRERSLVRQKKIMFSILVLIFFVALLVGIISIAHKTPSDYIRLAEKAYAKGNRDQALEYLLKAEKDAPQEGEAYLLRARYFQDGGDFQSAIDELTQITNSAAFGEDDLRTAYTDLAAIYYSESDFLTLYELMDRCPFEDLKSEYIKDIPAQPVVTPQDGEYEGKVEVSIEKPEGATAVYYTLDGSEPGANKMRYTEPLVFEETGDVTVKAVAVNEKGLMGEVRTAVYKVKAVKVRAPQILQSSGNYSKSTKIVVMADPNVEVHYMTGEDAVPDEDSPIYTEPIDMPVGESFFNFVSIDEKGNLSEVVSRQYILQIERRISEQNAVSYVQNELQTRGYWDASIGVQVEGVIQISNDAEVYVLREYKDGAPTGLLYAVNTQTGLTKRLGYDSQGQAVLMPF